MADMLRVVIAEDNYLVREGTRRLLEDSGEVRVEAAVGDAGELLDVVGRLDPDVVVTDIRMPPSHHMEGIAAAHAIRRQWPHIGVVVLSQHVDEAYAFELLKDGTDGLAYLLKDRVGDLTELLGALRAVSTGSSVIDPRVVENLVARRSRVSESTLTRLTPRETDVMREMAQGKTNAGIGSTLSLSESAVEKHVNAIFQKLGLSEERSVNRRVVAVLTFLRDEPVVEHAPASGPPETPERLLATMLFVDIVESTRLVSEVGDREWRQVLNQFEAIVNRYLERFRGAIVNPTGDGILARFDTPAAAVRCAVAVRDAVRPLGLTVRAGLHTGEVERRGADIAGIAVHRASRIAAAAQPSEVLVSHTVHELVAGSGIRFKRRGAHKLRGMPSEVYLYAVSDDETGSNSS